MLKNNGQSYDFFDGTKNVIYEDEQSIVLEEKLNPPRPLYLLVVPKKNISMTTAMTDDKKLLGHLILVANKIARRKGFQGNSYNIMIDEDLKTGKIKSMRVIGKDSKTILWPITPCSRL